MSGNLSAVPLFDLSTLSNGDIVDIFTIVGVALVYFGYLCLREWWRRDKGAGYD